MRKKLKHNPCKNMGMKRLEGIIRDGKAISYRVFEGTLDDRMEFFGDDTWFTGYHLYDHQIGESPVRVALAVGYDPHHSVALRKLGKNGMNIDFQNFTGLVAYHVEELASVEEARRLQAGLQKLPYTYAVWHEGRKVRWVMRYFFDTEDAALLENHGVHVGNGSEQRKYPEVNEYYPLLDGRCIEWFLSVEDYEKIWDAGKKVVDGILRDFSQGRVARSTRNPLHPTSVGYAPEGYWPREDESPAFCRENSFLVTNKILKKYRKY